MILDALANSSRYAGVHPSFSRALAFLAANKTIGTGRHDLDGDRLFVLVSENDGRGTDATLEAHRAYIDIQMALDGTEEIGWRPAAECRHPIDVFDTAKDVIFFEDRPRVWIPLPHDHFAIFFPEDAHAPLGGRGRLRKAVVKVAVEDGIA
jgi:biofilm protein TabA